MAQSKTTNDETPTAQPFTRPFDLSRMPEAGAEIDLVVNEAERTATAQWAGVEFVESLTARITITKRDSIFRYEASFEAEVTQACVVTLEPVKAKVSGTLMREYVPGEGLRRSARAAKAKVVASEVAIDAEEGPEALPGSMLDLASPLLEEFALSLDPYPRAPNAVFNPPDDTAEPKENPFAILRALKKPE